MRPRPLDVKVMVIVIVLCCVLVPECVACVCGKVDPLWLFGMVRGHVMPLAAHIRHQQRLDPRPQLRPLHVQPQLGPRQLQCAQRGLQIPRLERRLSTVHLPRSPTTSQNTHRGQGLLLQEGCVCSVCVCVCVRTSSSCQGRA